MNSEVQVNLAKEVHVGAVLAKVLSEHAHKRVAELQPSNSLLSICGQIRFEISVLDRPKDVWIRVDINLVS